MRRLHRLRSFMEAVISSGVEKVNRKYGKIDFEKSIDSERRLVAYGRITKINGNLGSAGGHIIRKGQ